MPRKGDGKFTGHNQDFAKIPRNLPASAHREYILQI